jgi:hypothetical protein
MYVNNISYLALTCNVGGECQRKRLVSVIRGGSKFVDKCASLRLSALRCATLTSMGVVDNFRRAAGIGSMAHFLWTLLPAAWQLAAITALATATEHYGYTQLGPARSLYYSSGVFAFGMVSFFCFLRIQQMIGIFKRISVPNVGARSVVLDKSETEIQNVILGMDLTNDSQQPIFYRLRRVNAKLADRALASDLIDDKNTFIIPAFGGVVTILVGSILGVPLRGGVPSGIVELELDYGGVDGELSYRMHYKAVMHVMIVTPIGTKQKQAQIIAEVSKFEHTKSHKAT